MSHYTDLHKESGRSIVFLTDNEKNIRPLVSALAQEEFDVALEKKNMEQLHPHDDAALLIIDSSRFSLEELSTYPRIRAAYSGLLMLLIDDIDEMLQVMLYEQGVDDMLFKPVNQLLMLARIRALLRRAQHSQTAQSTIRVSGMEINGGTRRATYRDTEIPFTSREFDLLLHMAKNAYMTLDRDNLYRAVFGNDYNGYYRAIDMYIARLRAKLSPYPALNGIIKTVRGSGYLFAAEQ